MDGGSGFAAHGEALVFLGCFADFPDPRQRGKVIYPLEEVLLLCLLAVLAGGGNLRRYRAVRSLPSPVRAPIASRAPPRAMAPKPISSEGQLQPGKRCFIMAARTRGRVRPRNATPRVRDLRPWLAGMAPHRSCQTKPIPLSPYRRSGPLPQPARRSM